MSEIESWRFPTKPSSGSSQQLNAQAQKLEYTAALLVEILADFNIEAHLVNTALGPSITRYDFLWKTKLGVRRIASLSDDLAMLLNVPYVKIAAIPGKGVIGISIPNKTVQPVFLRDVINSEVFQCMTSPVSMAFGKNEEGEIVTADLERVRHLLIAGTTGSGKSAFLRSLILSLVCKSSPTDLRLVLIDFRNVEFSDFSCLPHLLMPIISNVGKACGALRWAVAECTLRHKQFRKFGVCDIARYNEIREESCRLPRVVVVIDGMEDFALKSNGGMSDALNQLTRLGRSAGVHLIIAVQRPTVNIVLGSIRANLPTKIAFAVSSSGESRIILGENGAEKLRGKGDCLLRFPGSTELVHMQAAFVSDEEVQRVMDYFEQQSGSEPQFDKQIMEDMTATGGAKGGAFGEGKQEDELLGEAVRIVVDSGQASISMIQRKLRVGYARAARLVDMMEEHGYVSGFDGSKPRKVLIKRAQFEALFGDGEGIDAGTVYEAPAPVAPPVSADSPADGDDAPWDD